MQCDETDEPLRRIAIEEIMNYKALIWDRKLLATVFNWNYELDSLIFVILNWLAM